MKNVDEILESLINTPSDINEHLITLKKYAKECNHITEMGTRYVCSTWAFVAAKPKKIICYDILTMLDLNKVNQRLDEIKTYANNLNIDFTFNLQNVLEIQIDETELLFIDTLHTYKQLTKELELHSDKVSKYIILHDTSTFGEKDELMYGKKKYEFNEPKVGIWNAVLDFLETDKGKKWEIFEKYNNNNGLTILKQKNYERK